MRAYRVICLSASALGLLMAMAPSLSLAQERSSVTSSKLQTTWSSLADTIHAANTRSEAVNTRVNQIVTCNKKFKLYAPGMPGNDADGCVEDSLLNQITNQVDKAEQDILTINTMLTTLDTKITQNISRIDGNISGLSGRVDALAIRMNLPEQDVMKLKNDVNALTANVDALSARIENVYNALNSHISNNAANSNNYMNSQLARVDGRINDTENWAHAVNNRFTAELNWLNAQIATINAQINDLYNRTNDLYNRTNDLYGQMGSVRYCASLGMVYNQAGGCQQAAGGGGISGCNLVIAGGYFQANCY